VLDRRVSKGHRGALAVGATVISLLISQDARAQQTPREARVSALTGALEVVTPQRREGAVGDALAEGQHVRVPEGASATFEMHGGATLVARDHADLFLYGDPSAQPIAGQPPARDTVARRGVFVLRVPEGARSLVLVTPSCAITLSRGEAMVRADGRRTRVTIVRGRARLRAMGREVAMRDWMGAKVELNQPAAPRPLVGAPTFRGTFPSTYTFGGTVDVPVTWGAPRGTSAVRYRVQVSREQDFDALLGEHTVSAPATTHTLRLPAGRFFVRVMGIDADELEGRWSATQTIEIAGPRVLPGAEGRMARVAVPQGMRCGLDSSPPALQPGPMDLTPGRHHTLRCLRGEDGSEPVEMRVTAEESGPLRHQVRVSSDVEGDQRTLALRLTDARGYGVPYASVRVEAPSGVIVERVVEGTERGTYNASLRWPSRIGRGRLRFTINDAESFEETVEP
jgi:hypothetical protein